MHCLLSLMWRSPVSRRLCRWGQAAEAERKAAEEKKQKATEKRAAAEAKRKARVSSFCPCCPCCRGFPPPHRPAIVCSC